MLKLLSLLFSLLLFDGCFLSFAPKSVQPFPAQSAPSVWKRSAPQAAVPPYDDDRDRLLSIARAQLGTPYRYGGMDRSGFDCSGFVCYVYREALGKKLPHSALQQSQYVEIYDLDQLEPGDLLFFDTSGRGVVNHCGIYLGEGKFIHASSGKVYSVTTSDLRRGFYRRAFCFGGKVRRW